MRRAWVVFSFLIMCVRYSSAELKSCGDGFELDCPISKHPNISVKYDENKSMLTIECRTSTSDAEIHRLLPVNGTVDTAKFRNCSAQFSQILRQLGVSSLSIACGVVEIAAANISENLFDDVTNLTDLEFMVRIDRLPAKIFNKLTKLNRLTAKDNGWTQLSDSIFQNQKNLKYLILRNNKLRNLSEAAFHGVASNVELDLAENEIETLRWDVFSYLVKMTLLDLSKNRIKSLPNGLLAENTNLKTIILKRNSLASLPHHLLSSQSNLVELDLSDNRLSQFPVDLFRNTAELRILCVSRNLFTNISEHSLAGLRQLEILHFDGNSLLFIDPKAFSHIPNLIELHLQKNRLSFTEETEAKSIFDKKSRTSFNYLHDIRILNLSHNNVSHFLTDWKMNNWNLVSLDLSHNNFSSFNFSQIPNLWKSLTVDLSHNRIRNISVSDGIIKDEHTHSKWILNKNPFNCDCTILNLAKFARSRDKSAFTYVIDNLSCAEPLRFSGKLMANVSLQDLLCPIESCPLNCSCWRRPNDQSAIINCSNSNFEQFPRLDQVKIADLHLMNIELHLDNNRITWLPSNDTVGYQNVTKLYLRNNSVSFLSVDNLPTALTEIDLSNNKFDAINSLPIGHFEKKPELKVRLGGNPWKCDCDFHKFKTGSHSHLHITCGASDAELLQLNDKCGPMPIWKVILICILGSTIVLAAGFLYCASRLQPYQKKIRMWLHDRGWCLQFWPPNENSDWSENEWKFPGISDALSWPMRENNASYEFDVFISYSEEDNEFVLGYLQPKLEDNEPHTFKLCVHSRDWIAGESIPEQIYNSVENSRNTVIVLSENFVESRWCELEFAVAIRAPHRVIVIILGNDDCIAKLDPILKKFVTLTTYIKWDDDEGSFGKLTRALLYDLNRTNDDDDVPPAQQVDTPSAIIVTNE